MISALLATLGATGVVGALVAIGGMVTAFFKWLTSHETATAEKAKASAAETSPEVLDDIAKGKDGIADLNKLVNR